MIIAQELWEVVKQDEKHPQCALMSTQPNSLFRFKGYKQTPGSSFQSVIKQLFRFNVDLYLVEDLHRFDELYIPQERGEVLKEVDQQLCIHGPTLEDISPSYKTTAP